MFYEALRMVCEAGCEMGEICAADRIACDLTNFACDCLVEESARTGYVFHAQL